MSSATAILAVSNHSVPIFDDVELCDPKTPNHHASANAHDDDGKRKENADNDNNIVWFTPLSGSPSTSPASPGTTRSSPTPSLLDFSLHALALRYAEYEAFAAAERERLLGRIEELSERCEELSGKCEMLEEENFRLRLEGTGVGGGVDEIAEGRADSEEEMAIGSGETGSELFKNAEEADTPGLNCWKILDEAAYASSNVSICEETRAENGMVDPMPGLSSTREEATTAEEVVGTRTTDTAARPPVETPVVEEDDIEIHIALEFTELDTAASTSYESQTVDNSFVDEIMQDNSELHKAMALQSETLAQLQDEVKGLRKRLSGIQAFETDTAIQGGSRRASLVEPFVRRRSLAADFDHKRLREVHVHHHYHTGPQKQNVSLLGRSKSQGHAKPRKGHHSAAPHTFHRGPSTRQPVQRPPLETIASQSSSNPAPSTPVTALRVPTYTVPLKLNFNHSNRYSSSSSQRSPSLAVSSNPSTPQSTIFEPGDQVDGLDFSRPTSRGSSVVWRARWGSGSPEGLGVSSELEYNALGLRTLKLPYAKPASERDGGSLVLPKTRRERTEDTTNNDLDFQNMPLFSPSSLLRNASIASAYQHPLLSPTTTLLAPTTAIKATAAISLHPEPSSISLRSIPQQHDSQPQIATRSLSSLDSTTTSTARTTAVPRPKPETHYARPQKPVRNSSAPDADASEPKPDAYTPLVDTLGKRVGGWLSARLGGGAAGVNVAARAVAHSAPPAARSGSGGCRARRSEPALAHCINAYGPAADADADTDALADADTDINPTINTRPATEPPPNTPPPTSPTLSPPESEHSDSIPPPRTSVTLGLALTNDDKRRRKDLMHAAGLDPVSGLPALRQVSGVAGPRMKGEVDEDALRECLVEGEG